MGGNVREIWNFNQERKLFDIIFNCDLIGEGSKMNVACQSWKELNMY